MKVEEFGKPLSKREVPNRSKYVQLIQSFLSSGYEALRLDSTKFNIKSSSLHTRLYHTIKDHNYPCKVVVRRKDVYLIKEGNGDKNKEDGKR